MDVKSETQVIAFLVESREEITKPANRIFDIFYQYKTKVMVNITVFYFFFLSNKIFREVGKDD